MKKVKNSAYWKDIKKQFEDKMAIFLYPSFTVEEIIKIKSFFNESGPRDAVLRRNILGALFDTKHILKIEINETTYDSPYRAMQNSFERFQAGDFSFGEPLVEIGKDNIELFRWGREKLSFGLCKCTEHVCKVRVETGRVPISSIKKIQIKVLGIGRCLVLKT